MYMRHLPKDLGLLAIKLPWQATEIFGKTIQEILILPEKQLVGEA